jgi:hypothetical protein
MSDPNFPAASEAPGGDVDFLVRVMLYQDDALDAEALAAFEAELRDLPAKRKLFAEAQIRSACLHDLFRQAAQPAAPVPVRTRRPATPKLVARSAARTHDHARAVSPRRTTHLSAGWQAAVIAVVFCAAVWAGILFIPRAGKPARPSVAIVPAGAPSYVATMVAADDAANRERLASGERLAPGIMKVEAGRVLINLDGGARMVLVGPAEIDIGSRASARLISGKVAVRAPEDGSGFSLNTPEGDIRDLGTEFVANVENGATECHVLDGEVEWQFASASQKLTIQEREARVFRDRASAPIEAITGRFQNYLPTPVRAPAHELYAYEPFEYSKSRLAAREANGGTGWPASWKNGALPEPPNSEAPMHFDLANSLPMPDGLEPSRGGSMAFAEGQMIFRRRDLAKPVRCDTDSVHYISYLYRGGIANFGRNRELKEWEATGPFRLAVRTWKLDDFQTMLFSLGTSCEPYLSANGIESNRAKRIAVGKPVFVVGKIATSRDEPDQIFMRIYQPGETVDVFEPPKWTLSSPLVSADGKLETILLGIPPSADGRFDELRHGSTWRAVVPFTEAALRQFSQRTP